MSGAHHLEIEPEVLAGNDGLGRYIFLPGSRDRAARMAGRFTDARALENRRGLDVHVGKLVRGDLSVDVAAVPTGMGCPSVDIVVTELIQLGGRRFLRIGTAGTLHANIGTGDLVVGTGGVRDEATSDAYLPREVPAVADPVMVDCLVRAAERTGLGERVYAGLVHSKDSFFGREFAEGPDGARNEAYMKLLSDVGVLASEMEAAHLFILGQIHGDARVSAAAQRTRAVRLRCGALMAIVGDQTGFASREDEQAAEERMLDLAAEAVLDLGEMEA